MTKFVKICCAVSVLALILQPGQAMMDALALKDHPLKCLDLLGAVTTNGAAMQIWDCWGGPHQRWLFQGDQIVYKNDTSRCLDLKDGSMTNGNDVVLWQCHGGVEQQWVYDSDTFTIKYKASDGTKCIDLNDFDTRNGRKVQIWDCHGSSNQRWVLGDGMSGATVVEVHNDQSSVLIAAVVLLAILLVASIMYSCLLRQRIERMSAGEKASLSNPSSFGRPAAEDTTV
jgi:hypothetical protein